MSSPAVTQDQTLDGNQRRDAAHGADDHLLQQDIRDLPAVDEPEGYVAEPVGGHEQPIDPIVQAQVVYEDTMRPMETDGSSPSAIAPKKSTREGSIRPSGSRRKNINPSSPLVLPESEASRKVLRGSSSNAIDLQSKLPSDPGPAARYTNKEQLAILRQFYLENPTPTKSQILELASTTGRHWSKVKEYFRQRRNKLRGVDEAGLDGMQEPDRATSWLQMSYRPVASATVPQLDVYLAYQSRFDPYHKASPLLGGQDLIRLACATFGECSLARDDEGEWVMRGLGERPASRDVDSDGQQSDGPGRKPRKLSNLEEYLVGMPEPLRASTWLIHNYEAGQSSTQDVSAATQSARKAAVSQTDLYASYVARFAAEAADDAAGAQSSYQSDLPRVLRDSSTMEVAPPEGLSPAAMPNGEAQPDINRDDSDRKGNETEPSKQASTQRISRHPTRLLNPLELINLAKMTFPGAEAKVDDQGNFVIKGLDRREGVGKYKTPAAARSNDIFPFGLLNVEPSSADHPFTSLIKRKLDVLEGQSEPQARTKRHASHVNSPDPRDTRTRPIDESELGQGMFTAADFDTIAQIERNEAVRYGQALPPADRELVEGLRRFKDSRLGTEIRDVCVQQ